MINTDNQSIFEQLNKTKHSIIKDGQFSLFPNEIPNNPKLDSEYWYFSDIYNTYNKDYTPTYHIDMKRTLQKNLYMPDNQSHKTLKLVPCDYTFLSNHSNEIKHAYKLGYHQYTRANDLQLSRYACWCLLKTAPDKMFSYTYFVSPIIKENISFSELEKISYQFARPYSRANLANSNRIFNGIICKLNTNPETINVKKIKLFFDGHNTQTLKAAYHITDPKISILDHMGAHSMEYLTKALDKTAFQADNPKKCKNANQFEMILLENLNQARQDMIRQTGIKPEDDIQKLNLSSVQHELKLIETEFIKRYAVKKLH